MSANNPIPLFTLVRNDFLEDTEDLDYRSTSKEGKFRDEIKLIDGNGEPCAVPSSQGVEDLDYEYEYIDGSKGGISRVLRQKIVMKCDFLEGETRRKLHQWKQDRAEVLFTPGYGSKTECAWRPVPDSTAVDLTGRYVKTETNSDTEAHYVWDDYLMDGIMRKFEDDVSRQIKTPAGAMQMFADATSINLADPATPPFDDDSGWSPATGSGTIGETYIADGFGCTGCPHSTRFDFIDGATDGVLEFDFPSLTLDSNSTVFVTVWVKGHLDSTATMRLKSSLSITESVAIGEMDLSSWTPVHIVLNTDWSVTTHQSLKIYSESVTAYGSLEIGPIVITGTNDNYGVPHPQWSESGETVSAERVMLADVDFPGSGTETASFWLSDRVSDLDPTVFDICYRDDGGTMYLSDTGSAGNVYLNWNNGADTHNQYFEYDLLNFGGANAVSVVYSTRDISYYVNGTLIGVDTAEHGDLGIDDLEIGRATRGGSGIHGLLTYRLDREKLTADEVANLHKQLTDAGSLEVTVPARGRVFRIESIPSTPRATSGGTHWIGNLVLEQVDYDSSLEDLTSKEY